MEINILAFGIAKDIIGGNAVEIAVEDPMTVKNLRRALETKFSQFSQLSSYMIAVNNNYAQEDQIISSQDEVAIIPPVSGG